MKLSFGKSSALTFLAAILTVNLACNCLCSTKKTGVVTNPIRIDVGNGKAWNFVVSGDSRNCGDVVMPAIAQGAANDHAAFYWHLGDIRAGYDFDEDLLGAAAKDGKKLRISDYVGNADASTIGAWDDFKQSQIAPFQNQGIPFFLGIGNHETIWPQSRDRFTKYFASQLDVQWLRDQRLFDLQKHNPVTQDSGPKTYYHWIVGTVDFIYLDNASPEQFDAAQVKWFEEVLKEDRDKQSPVTTVIVGMHAALPYSLSQGHSMNEFPDGEKSGEQIYKDLLDFQISGKKVYVLASHSHFYMKGIFNTAHWPVERRLAGWIVGTAGAVRYRLPADASLANEAKTDVYGYLLGTVNTDGSVDFKFQEFKQSDIPPAVTDRYTKKIVDWCFAENKRM
ncbi:MAG TPA: metallophosphoesterase [Terriglobales bacterium]|nr:metallophosphoesterase [Terriglobales bacterium]